MNILFLSLGDFENMQEGSVHIDIIKEFAKKHNVYLVCKRERRYKKPTELSLEYGVNILRVKVGNIKKTNLIEKGISTVLVETQFTNAIRKYFKDIKFDLVIYSTPPITFAKVVRFVKKRDAAKTYLLLKDIFPQNAVDIGMMTKTGIKGIIYKYFRKKEKELYAVSDRIGCMSQANVDYTLKHNPEISKEIVEICPNSIAVIDKSVNLETRNAIRSKYDIPLDKKVFIYGGNLGKPQGIPFLIECLKSQKNNNQAYFLVVGDGTEYGNLEAYFHEAKPANMKLMKRLPKEDYDTMVAACDVGMIFLDHRFAIPNFPSRILSYMQAKIPVLAVTDPNTDVGEVIISGEFGWWCESNDVERFSKMVNAVLQDSVVSGEKGFDYLKKYYSVAQAYEIIMKSIDECKDDIK